MLVDLKQRLLGAVWQGNERLLEVLVRSSLTTAVATKGVIGTVEWGAPMLAHAAITAMGLLDDLVAESHQESFPPAGVAHALHFQQLIGLAAK